MPKDWTISFIEELGPSRLMMTPLISNVILKASVEKDPIEIEAIHQVADKKMTP